MRIKLNKDTNNNVTGYQLWLSRNDTYTWANDPYRSWPGSTLRNERVFVGVDRNGLYDVSPEDCDANELEAIVSDYLPKEARHLWPTWESVTEGKSYRDSEGGFYVDFDSESGFYCVYDSNGACVAKDRNENGAYRKMRSLTRQSRSGRMYSESSNAKNKKYVVSNNRGKWLIGNLPSGNPIFDRDFDKALRLSLRDAERAAGTYDEIMTVPDAIAFMYDKNTINESTLTKESFALLNTKRDVYYTDFGWKSNLRQAQAYSSVQSAKRKAEELEADSNDGGFIVVVDKNSGKVVSESTSHKGKNMNGLRSSLRERVGKRVQMFEDVMRRANRLVLERNDVDTDDIDLDDKEADDYRSKFGNERGDRYRSIEGEYPSTDVGDRKLFTNRLNRGLKKWVDDTPNKEELKDIHRNHRGHTDKAKWALTWLDKMKDEYPDVYADPMFGFVEAYEVLHEILGAHQAAQHDDLSIRRDISSAMYGTPKTSRESLGRLTTLKSSHQSMNEVWATLSAGLDELQNDVPDIYAETSAGKLAKVLSR